MQAENTVSDAEFSFYGNKSGDDLDVSFENEAYWSDTDDGIGEANAIDDMYKILEGDWLYAIKYM